MKKQILFASAALMVAAVVCVKAAGEGILIQDGETIGFLGDSITAGGGQAPVGYIHLVMDGLKRAGVKDAKAIMAGVSGDNAPKMDARVEAAVLSKKPQWMTLSCGVNDVWWRGDMTIETYKTHIRSILDKAATAGVKVIVLSATMIEEKDQKGLHAEQLVYNAFLKEEAARRGLVFVDMWEAEAKALAAREDGQPGNKLTRDGVHMNVYGNQMMALAILRAMGVGESVLKEAEGAWCDLDRAHEAWVGFTQPEYEKLHKAAASEESTAKERWPEKAYLKRAILKRVR